MHPPPASPDGSLFFDDTGEFLSPRMSVAEFERTRLRHAAALDLAPDGATCRLGERRVGGERFHVTLHFDAGARLRRVDLYPLCPGDGTTWADWSLAKEMDRKAWAEGWAKLTFGEPLTIKAIEIPELPEAVMPAAPGPDHPRHAVFPWGEVCSYFDSKAGFAGVWIAYT